MDDSVLERSLADERATVLLGQDIAATLRNGDVLALQGDLGAGKTTLARGLIRALAADPELEVPSPTFTLVQSYETRIPIQHFDLYRLSSVEELDELGFDEAGKQGIAIVEWPEKAGDHLPGGTIFIELRHEGEGRRAIITGPQAALIRIERSFAARNFLDRTGNANADRAPFSDDASARRYETVSAGNSPSRILMDSPRLVLGRPIRGGKPYAEIAHTAQTATAFVAIARMLKAGGVTVPEIFEQDLDQGFLLVENLGTGNFLDKSGQPVPERLVAAAELLAAMHARKWPDEAEAAPGIVHRIPPFDRDAMLIEVELLLDWYVPAVYGKPANDSLRKDFTSAWDRLLDRLDGKQCGFMHRDFQSPNIIWRGDRSGHDRLGIVDFQDGLIGPTAYDVASIALDARVTMTPELENIVVDAYRAARHAQGGFNAEDFAEAYAIMAAQRNSKILGIFVRLDRRDGKPFYLRHLPRIRDYLRRVLAHPSLAELRVLYEKSGFLEERAL
jgi:tRNA threonylcarbamoyl adenosine modification protein YjeE